ncbi:MAG: methionine--tRNA ligase [Candidatus Cloacimonetes bacterium]|nr:methionine--tRNA ligase [Candidatus Cloacimonadota bacterium]
MLERILVTSALTYANGPLHIGHVAGSYLNADIFVRYCKLKGKDVIYIGGTDDHGAPISIKAEEEGISPQELVARYNKSMKEDLKKLSIELDNFSSTSTSEHNKLSQDFFLNLMDAGYINQKTSKQFYDKKHKRFLPDRYIEGICPYCKSPEARGDQCDSCGKLIDAVNLIEPRSKISGETPVIKETTHWYLNLPKFEPELRKWLETKKYWKDNVRNFILSWLDEGLIERAITRDIDWGVPVPLENAKGKVLYVWFDAPIGYISSTKEWAKRQGKPDLWKEYWLNPETKLIHFLGKDNIPFHTIIWPAVLSKQKDKYVLPYDVPANEFLNLEGQKMSTSRSWTVWVEDYLKYFEGELLRYVLAANAPETKDSDFTWKDFQNKINNDLNNVLGNLANRTFIFAKKYFDGKIEEELELSESSQMALRICKDTLSDVENSFNTYQVRKAVKSIIDIARSGNKYFDETKPWKEIKTNKQKANETLYVCAELLNAISIALYPILPDKMLELRKMMNLSGKFCWKDIWDLQRRFIIGEVSPLFKKIEDAEIEKQLELLKATRKGKEKMEHKSEITFDDFEKLEMRIGKILEAENIPKSKKLLKLKVDIGGEERSVVAGISESYEPKELIGKKVAMLINLNPRKVMGVESQAMILAAEDEGELVILVPEKDIKEGSEIS